MGYFLTVLRHWLLFEHWTVINCTILRYIYSKPNFIPARNFREVCKSLIIANYSLDSVLNCLCYIIFQRIYILNMKIGRCKLVYLWLNPKQSHCEWKLVYSTWLWWMDYILFWGMAVGCPVSSAGWTWSPCPASDNCGHTQTQRVGGRWHRKVNLSIKYSKMYCV